MRIALLRLGCWVLAVSALLALAGCGGSGGSTEASSSAKPAARRLEPAREAWISIADHQGADSVGILMAQERGYFEDLGIEMTVTSSAAPQGALEYVVDEEVEFGVTRQPEVVLAREEGEPVVAVGTLLARPTAALIWLKKSGIDGISDLKGKTIAISGFAFQRAFLRSLLEKHGLTPDDVKVLEVGYDAVGALSSGKADAIFGGSGNVEGAVLAARGLEPVVRRVENLGLPAYDEQVLIARSDRVAEDGPLVRDVLAAIARGTAAAVEHPEAAAEVIEKGEGAGPAATSKETEAEIKETLPLLSETGYMNQAQAEELVDWMHGEGLIQRKIPVSRLLTNRLLPE